MQSLIWIAGTVVLTIGVAGIYLGRPEMEPIAIVGSFLVLGAMLLFAYLVFRMEGQQREHKAEAEPIGLAR